MSATGPSAYGTEPPWSPERPTDTDRVAALKRAQAALASGRLSRERYEERAAAIRVCRTAHELEALVGDLPDTSLDGPREPSGRAVALVTGLVGMVVAVVGLTMGGEGDPGGGAPRTEVQVTASVGSRPPGGAAAEARPTTTLSPFAARMAAMRDQVRSEGWFTGCPAATAALSEGAGQNAGISPARLSDIVPGAGLGGFELAGSGPVGPDLGGERPWLEAAVDAHRMREGFAAVYGQGWTGSDGGFTVSAFRFADGASAERALRSSYTALVCRFGAEPWRLSAFPGAIAAARGGDAEVSWVTADVLIVLNWAVRQPPEEALPRAEAAAQAVRAKIESA